MSDTIITSSAPHGTIIVMNVYIDPSNKEKYLKLTEPIAKKFRTFPENLFVQVCASPVDPGHLRMVHGWSKNSDWWRETFVKAPWFADYIAEAKPMWVKPRLIEDFDRYPTE